MKILFDTNVIIDAFTARDYDYKDSRNLIIMVANKEIDGYISCKQVTDIYYILRKYVSDNQKRIQIIKDVTNTFKMLPVLPSDIKASFGLSFEDFEDAVIEETAKINMIQYIVTHNISHFKNSRIAAVSPHDMISLLEIK